VQHGLNMVKCIAAGSQDNRKPDFSDENKSTR